MEHPPRNPVTRRGLYAFGAVALGIVTASELPGVPALAWFACACVSLVIAGLLGERGTASRIARPMLALAAACIGAGAMSARVLTVPADRLSIGETGLLIIRGTAATQPRADTVSDDWQHPPHWRGPATVFELSLDSVQLGGTWLDASGTVAVYSQPSGLRLKPGDRVELTGHFRPIVPPTNPGQRDPRIWAAQEGRVGSLTIEDADAAVRLGSTPGAWGSLSGALTSTLTALRDRASNALNAALGPSTSEDENQPRALLRAMLIGGEEPALRPVSDDMSRLGIVHIISISGFHLALVAWVLLQIIRLTGDRGVWEYPLAALAILLYLLIVPAQAPVMRSGLMVLALLVTEATGRRYDRLNVLAWTACLLALWRPLDLFSPGYQLSFGVTAALIWRASDWNERLLASGWLGMPGVKGRRRREPTTFVRWLIQRAAELAVATAIAWLVSFAVVAWHMGTLSLLGVVAGIALTVPSIFAIAAGFVAMLVALVWPSAGEIIGSAALFFSDLTVRGSHLAAQLPASSIPLPQMPLAWAVATTAVAVAALTPGIWSKPLTRIAALGCAIWFLAILFFAGQPIPQPTIDRFALPKSSATLIRSADQALLIDPGSSAKQSGAFTIRRAVAACGAWRVRTVLITGPQTERFDHLPDLVRAFAVTDVLLPQSIVDNARTKPDSDQARLLKRLAALGVSTRVLAPDEAVAIGTLTITPRSAGVVQIDQPGAPATTLQLAPIPAAEHTTLPPTR